MNNWEKSKSKSKSKKPPPCYHGCTKKEFHSGAHYKTLEEELRQLCLADTTTLEEKRIDFHDNIKHGRMGGDPTLGRFVSAHIADDYLKGKDNANLRIRLLLLFQLRYFELPWREGKDIGPGSDYYCKFHKYVRDITKERRRINCMAR